MIEWKQTRPMPKSGFFLTTHLDSDGAWVPEIAWWEPKVSGFIIDLNGKPLRMEMGSFWAEINTP